MYLPVYLFPALLVHRKRLLDLKLASDIARRAALGAMRSSLFLSLYCTLAWRGACVGFQHSSESPAMHDMHDRHTAVAKLTSFALHLELLLLKCPAEVMNIMLLYVLCVDFMLRDHVAGPAM